MTLSITSTDLEINLGDDMQVTSEGLDCNVFTTGVTDEITQSAQSNSLRSLLLTLAFLCGYIYMSLLSKFRKPKGYSR